MAVIIDDKFTEASDVTLNNHTPDVGGAWGAEASSINVNAANDRIQTDSGGAQHEARNADTADQDDVKVAVDIQMTAFDPAQVKCCMCRMGSADQDGFVGGMIDGTTTARMKIDKIVSGSKTTLATSGDDSHALNTVFDVRLEAINNGADTDLELFVDDVSLLTATESTDPKQGASFRNFGIQSRRAGTMDNYLAETIVAAAALLLRNRRAVAPQLAPTRAIYH